MSISVLVTEESSQDSVIEIAAAFDLVAINFSSDIFGSKARAFKCKNVSLFS